MDVMCCPNKCGEENIRRRLLDEHREICPLEVIDCPFAEEGCQAKDLLRKDEAKHMVSHQILMLEAQKDLERKLTKFEYREKQRIAGIDTHLNSLLATCNTEQQSLIQSIRSLMGDLLFLKKDESLTFRMENFSIYVRDDKVWYSPLFYLEKITGPKLQVAVDANSKHKDKRVRTVAIRLLYNIIEVQKKMDTGCIVVVEVRGAGSKPWNAWLSVNRDGECTVNNELYYTYAQKLLCNDGLNLEVKFYVSGSFL